MKTAYEVLRSLVSSEICIRARRRRKQRGLQYSLGPRDEQSLLSAGRRGMATREREERQRRQATHTRGGPVETRKPEADCACWRKRPHLRRLQQRRQMRRCALASTRPLKVPASGAKPHTRGERADTVVRLANAGCACGSLGPTSREGQHQPSAAT